MVRSMRDINPWMVAPLLVAGLLVVACEDDPVVPKPPSEATGFSDAYDKWTPHPNDTCTGDIHNSYSTVGPDGLLYPTWHPPTDEATGCTFGHEHGRNPKRSDLYDKVGDIPFGLALPADHVGYKVEWENDVAFHFGSDAADALFEMSCDVMVELHQGSHGAGAFTINLHELVYHAQCSDGAEIHLTMISAIGDPGEFESACDGRTIVAGPPPPNSPQGGGDREIPTRECVEEFLLVPDGDRSSFSSGLRESWVVSDRIRTHDGRTLVSFNPYFQVLFPSRYFDPDMPNGLARSVDMCFEVTESGESVNGDQCDATTSNGERTELNFDDARSGFNGAQRFVDVNSINISNADGPEVWYTDKFGKNARRRPFPGSLRQYISRMDNERSIDPSGPAIGKDRNYAGKGTHAPN